MAIFVLSGGLLFFVLLALAFAGGGAREPTTASVATAPSAPPAVPAGSLSETTEQFIGTLGLQIVSREHDVGAGPGFVATGGQDANRQRVYIRAFDQPSGLPVCEPDVIAALDFARGEGFNKTLLISANGFSDEAVLAARDTIAELIQRGTPSKQP